jgi:hypothetical protein
MLSTSNGYYDDSLSLEDAGVYLREHLNEFPFADWREGSDGVMQSRSQAVHIAAMLSQFAGRLIPREALRLGYIYNSNAHGSGKSLLVKLAIVPPNGGMASQPWSPKDEELRKVLDAEVLRASRYICFDNVRAHVSSPVLEGFMTSPRWTGRLLGKTQMFEAANTATIFITGNDLSVSPDIKRRTLEVRLFVPEADMQARQVKHPIDDVWLTDPKTRRDILSALWAIVRYWGDSGKPLATKNLKIGYERWCQVFGGLVQFAGFGDPLAPPEGLDEEYDTDTETADVWSLVKGLAERILTGDERRCEYTFQEVVNIAHQLELFDWMLDGKDVTEYSNDGFPIRKDFMLKPDSRSRFGKLLKRYAPFAGDVQGPRHRLFHIGKADQQRAIKMYSMGSAGRRKFVVESPEPQAE